MVTRTRSSVAVVLGAALLALSACGKADLAQKFTGGSSSKDKAMIPSTVSAAQPVATPAPADVAVAGKPPAPAEATKPVEGHPIREKEMKYRSASVRDPFRSLISGSEDRSGLVDLSVVTLVGIVMGDDPFCIVEDAEGTAYVLRKGDRVRNGRVVSIKTDTMVASQTLLGFTSTVQMKLEEGKESHG